MKIHQLEIIYEFFFFATVSNLDIRFASLVVNFEG
jgi:hypothetical protein